MQLARMDKKTYSEFWGEESKQLDDQGIYAALSKETPDENVLEIGCGSGLSTSYLASTRSVLSIDNNEHLVSLANTSLVKKGVATKIIYADLFTLSEKEVNEIQAFAPKGIVCWFIGSHPDDVDKRTSTPLAISERPKKYRENIEDLLLTGKLCLPTIEWIHLANRVGVIESVSEHDIIEATKDDYNTHLFSSNGFEITNVKVIDWKREGSNFMYVTAHNPNLMPGSPVHRVISILAKRIHSAPQVTPSK